MSVVAVADQLMQVALRELKEVGRIAYPIAAQAFSAQHRIFERDGQRGMIRALGSAFSAGAELSTFDRAQAALGLLRKQLGPSLAPPVSGITPSSPPAHPPDPLRMFLVGPQATASQNPDRFLSVGV